MLMWQSSTISIVTGQQIARSDSVSSVTMQCDLYSDLLGGGAAWLDTVGWEDRKKDDAESFKDILRSDTEFYDKPGSYLRPCQRGLSGFRFILKAEMTDVLAVVWCVTPQV